MTSWCDNSCTHNLFYEIIWVLGKIFRHKLKHSLEGVHRKMVKSWKHCDHQRTSNFLILSRLICLLVDCEPFNQFRNPSNFYDRMLCKNRIVSSINLTPLAILWKIFILDASQNAACASATGYNTDYKIKTKIPAWRQVKMTSF